MTGRAPDKLGTTPASCGTALYNPGRTFWRSDAILVKVGSTPGAFTEGSTTEILEITLVKEGMTLFKLGMAVFKGGIALLKAGRALLRAGRRLDNEETAGGKMNEVTVTGGKGSPGAGNVGHVI